MYKRVIYFSLILLLASCFGAINVTADASTDHLAKKTGSLSQKLGLLAKQSTPIDWTKPSGSKYPIIHSGDKISIDVSIRKQTVRIKKNGKIVYTMHTSSGIAASKPTATPTGHYKIEAERGTWFYSPKYAEGAKYWTSWKNHGEFLFHSVPMDKNGKVKVKEALKLGTQASHGCFRLPIPDAKWIYEHIKQGTDVYIH